MRRVDDAGDGVPVAFYTFIKALPPRFSLGEFLEAAERRGLPAQESYAHLQTLKRAGSVEDDGFWFTKR